MDYSSSYFITSYVEYVKQQLGLANTPLPTAPKLGVISRKNRRRIVNEVQLLDTARYAIQSELIEYSGLSFQEQVRLVLYPLIIIPTCVQHMPTIYGIIFVPTFGHQHSLESLQGDIYYFYKF